MSTSSSTTTGLKRIDLRDSFNAFDNATGSNSKARFVPRTNTMPTPALKSSEHGGLVRTLTEGWKRQVENEDGVMFKVIANMDEHGHNAVEGDIPGIFYDLLIHCVIFYIL